MPEPRGFGFAIRAFVDADHATDSMTCKSRTGFLLFLNSGPIYWLSKKQTSVETSSFGSDFCAMKQCTDYICGLRYKLRMHDGYPLWEASLHMSLVITNLSWLTLPFLSQHSRRNLKVLHTTLYAKDVLVKRGVLPM
jgi:hypothetical protein